MVRVFAQAMTGDAFAMGGNFEGIAGLWPSSPPGIFEGASNGPHLGRPPSRRHSEALAAGDRNSLSDFVSFGVRRRGSYVDPVGTARFSAGDRTALAGWLLRASHGSASSTPKASHVRRDLTYRRALFQPERGAGGAGSFHGAMSWFLSFEMGRLAVRSPY